MKSLLEQMYHGKLFPPEQFAQHDSCYAKYREQFLEHCQSFQKQLLQLDPALGREFIRLIDEFQNGQPIEDTQVFLCGFRLGARMMAEVYQDMQ